MVLSVLTAAASPVAVDTIVRDRIDGALPSALGVSEVQLPASLASLATESDRVAVELPRELRAGRASAKVTVRGRASVYVSFAIGKRSEVAVVKRVLHVGATITTDDVVVERRVAVVTAAVPSTVIGSTVSHELAVGAVIGARDVALAPPLARGTQVMVEMRRGSVRVRGTAVLEAAARTGEPATARLAQTHIIVRGTLRAQTLVVGDAP